MISSRKAMSSKKPDIVGTEPPDGIVEKRSLFIVAKEEALKHKWVESEKVGHDLGKAALEDWNRRHWWRWCRGRWLEHLQGEVFWRELGPAYFGALTRQLSSDQLLQDRVVDRVKAGYENLDIILWATRWGLDINAVHEILRTLDMNSCRFAPGDNSDESEE